MLPVVMVVVVVDERVIAPRAMFSGFEVFVTARPISRKPGGGGGVLWKGWCVMVEGVACCGRRRGGGYERAGKV